MNRENAIKEVKQHLTDYLQGKGLPTNKPFNCLNPTHNDEHPSMSYDSKHNIVHCFSCGESYDLLDLIRIENNCDFNTALQIACKKYGITIESSTNTTPKTANKQPKQEYQKDYTAFISEAENNLKFAEGYIHERGLSMETARMFHLGVAKMPVYETDQSGQKKAAEWTCLIIPTSKNSFIMRNMDRAATKENRYQKRGKSHLFNFDSAMQETEKPIVITEGEIDAMSVIEVGGQAIGLGSTANINLLVNELEKRKPKTPLVLALDNDDAGRNATAELKQKLDKAGVKNHVYNPYGICKDANQALVTEMDSFKSSIAAINEDIEAAEADQQKQEYLKTSAAANLDDFINGISERANTPPISTGFMNLDMILDGGLYEGLYFLGAISSLGKTTLALQMADQIAQSGHDVLIFSLEMARSELMAKSISRLTYLETKAEGLRSGYAKTTRGILDGSRQAKYTISEKAIIQKAIANYREYAQHIFISEGIGNIGVNEIKKTVQKHISITGNRPVVIVDYVQILAPSDTRATDKQNTDKNVLELKRLSRDEKIPVIGISSFNRESYKADSANKGQVSMSDFKESGSIEYSSDVLIGLQFKAAGGSYNEKDEKKKDPREISLVILKNRNGKAWQSCDFNYYPMFNYFEERKEEAEKKKSGLVL